MIITQEELMIIYVWIVCLLFMGFLLLFGRMRWLEKLWELLHRTREGMDRASQLRAVENRHRLMEFQQKNNVWYRISDGSQVVKRIVKR